MLIGATGTLLAHPSQVPGAIWLMSAILPLLPVLATLLPLLAETEAAQHALQGQPLKTAFVIGVGVASGAIIVATYQAYRYRVLKPIVSSASEPLATHAACPTKRRAARWRRRTRPADAEHR